MSFELVLSHQTPPNMAAAAIAPAQSSLAKSLPASFYRNQQREPSSRLSTIKILPALTLKVDTGRRTVIETSTVDVQRSDTGEF
jgi:hypothetical protein